MSEALKEKIFTILEEVEDPELHVDIVNLGLIYDVEVDEELNTKITMTMTSMGCPMAGQIISDVKFILASRMEELKRVDVQIVWTPQWTKDRMSRYAKMALGIPF